MATSKSYVDISQSKTLSKILPLDSVDMFYYKNIFFGALSVFNEAILPKGDTEIEEEKMIPAWSLSALLDVLPKVINNETLFIETSPALWHIGYRNVYIARADNPIDACYELILKLHELKML